MGSEAHQASNPKHSNGSGLAPQRCAPGRWINWLQDSCLLRLCQGISSSALPQASSYGLNYLIYSPAMSKNSFFLIKLFHFLTQYIKDIEPKPSATEWGTRQASILSSILSHWGLIALIQGFPILGIGNLRLGMISWPIFLATFRKTCFISAV